MRKSKQKKGKRKPYVSEYQRRKLRHWFRAYKAGKVCQGIKSDGTPCLEDHPACIEFHHLDPDNKEDTIHHLIRIGAPIGKIKEELDKCIPVCANCHKKIHWEDKVQ